jgi:hypothetical protein
MVAAGDKISAALPHQQAEMLCSAAGHMSVY